MTAWGSLQSCDIEVTDSELPQIFLCERLSLVKHTKPLRLPHERLLEDVSHESDDLLLRQPMLFIGVRAQNLKNHHTEQLFTCTCIHDAFPPPL